MSKLYSNFIVNYDHKVIFAYVPKVACSNWKGIMRSLNGAENYLETSFAHDRTKSGLVYLSDLEDKDSLLNGNIYKKYCFVRDPYTRVLSAYLNKVESRLLKPLDEKDYFSKVTYHIDQYRIDNLDKHKYPETNFEVFLMWLQKSQSIFIHDEHWKPQHLLLDIKNVSFDKIGKFEKLYDEAQKFISLLGASVNFPSQKEMRFSPTKATDKISRYYNADCYDLVNEIYKEDFDFFGYEMKRDQREPKVIKATLHHRETNSIRFEEGHYVINKPIYIDSFDSIVGAGKNKTFVKVIGEFEGPFIQTQRLKENLNDGTWFYRDGVPVRFEIKDITFDLSEWKPVKTKKYSFKYGDISTSAIGIYGKCYVIENVTLLNCPGTGFISVCSAMGGQKDLYFDSPESKIDGLEVINTVNDGVIFAGPHDSILKEIIACHTNGKGVVVVADKKFSGACDIDFIHAYACEDVAIEIQAKVKARLLQGDTGRNSGVVIGGSNKTYVEAIEVFKTRGKLDDYAVRIDCSEGQFSTVRIRADAGTSGLKIAGYGNTIDNLHVITEEVHPSFKHLNIEDEGQPVAVSGNQNTVLFGRLISSKAEPVINLRDGGTKRFRGSFLQSSYMKNIKKTNEEIQGFDVSRIEITKY